MKTNFNININTNRNTTTERCFVSEKFSMRLQPLPFDMIKTGKKTIEVRLFDEKRQKIHVGDLIEFTQTDSGEKLVTKVKNLYKYNSFRALYKSIPLCLFGFENYTIETALESIYKYYSQEEEKLYGVLGIEIEVKS